MSLWGRNDQAVTANSTTTKESSNGAPIGTYTLVKGDAVNRVDSANAHFGNTSAGSRASVDVAMFGNTTMGAFIPGKAVGVFGVDPTEIGISSGNLALTYVTSGGTGYNANTANVTITPTNGGTGANAYGVANTTTNAGRITSLVIAANGGGFVTNPTITIPAPAAITFNGNTGVANSTKTITITTANSRFQVNDHITYTVATGNTSVIDGNTGPKTYNLYIAFTNTTVITVANAVGGANLTLTSAPILSETGHTIQGDTATGYVVVGGSHGVGIPHSGWVLRTEGSGGRAGRVNYEVLVAMGSLGAQTGAQSGAAPANTADASDNAILPNA